MSRPTALASSSGWAIPLCHQPRSGERRSGPGGRSSHIRGAGDEAGLARIRSRMGRNLSSYPEAMDVPRAMGHYREAAAVLGARPDDPANAYLTRAWRAQRCTACSTRKASGGAACRTRASVSGSERSPPRCSPSRAVIFAYRGDLAQGLEPMSAAAQQADEVDDAFAGFLACWIPLLGPRPAPRPGCGRRASRPRGGQAPTRSSAGPAPLAVGGVGDVELCRGRLAEARRARPRGDGERSTVRPAAALPRGRVACRRGRAVGRRRPRCLKARGNRADHASLTPWLALAQARVGRNEAAIAALVDALDGIARALPVHRAARPQRAGDARSRPTAQPRPVRRDPLRWRGLVRPHGESRPGPRCGRRG